MQARLNCTVIAEGGAAPYVPVTSWKEVEAAA